MYKIQSTNHLAVKEEIKQNQEGHKDYQFQHETQSPFTQIAMTAHCLGPDWASVTHSTDTLPATYEYIMKNTWTWNTHTNTAVPWEWQHITTDTPRWQISHQISCWVNEPTPIQISSMASLLCMRHFSNYVQGLNWD